jgi:gliding motility-associated-like protein
MDSITVTVLPAPTLSMSGDTYVCAGDSTQITATGTGTFEWSNGATLSDSTIANPIAFPSKPTWYTVTLTDGGSCQSIDSVFVDIQAQPFADAGSTVEACKFLPISMGGSPTGPPGSSFLWTPSTGLNFNGLANPLVTGDSDETYIVQVTDSLGCIAYDTVEVVVFRINGTTDTTICDNEPLVLTTSTSNGTGPFTYEWSPSNLVSDSTSGSPTVLTGSNTSFAVTITDVNGCRDTLDFNINALAATSASFDYDVIPTCDGIGVKINESSIGASGYEWFIDGNSVSTDENPLLVFDYNNQALVTLVTTSSDGCNDTSQTTVTGPSFDSLVDIAVSNVFTPNGDGLNDFFEITSNGDLSGCIELQIFNRDGVLVHNSTGGIHTWDGRSAIGKSFPDGVYFYVYNINGTEYKGNITLMR